MLWHLGFSLEHSSEGIKICECRVKIRLSNFDNYWTKSWVHRGFGCRQVSWWPVLYGPGKVLKAFHMITSIDLMTTLKSGYLIILFYRFITESQRN